jgi:hypothetical protein
LAKVKLPTSYRAYVRHSIILELILSFFSTYSYLLQNSSKVIMKTQLKENKGALSRQYNHLKYEVGEADTARLPIR